MKNRKLTVEQAFCAMFYFLEKEYELTKSEDVAVMLGSLDWTILADRSGTPDPAAWEDWINAVEKAKKHNMQW